MNNPTKMCSICGLVKQTNEFYKATRLKDGLQSSCKECSNFRTKKSRNKHRDKHTQYIKQTRINYQRKLYIWKGNIGCCVCGERDPVCLDLHHKDPKTKEFTIGDGNYNWKRLVNELVKCIVVCSNCHKKIHANHIDDIELPLVTREQCEM